MSEESHNLFFYANVCHVCKAFGTESPLKRCGSCRMISYCGKKHQRQHWTQHKDLCKILTDILGYERSTNGWCTFDSRGKNSRSKLWSRMKMNLMLLVQIKLGRSLEPYEKHMFQFPRACAVCHDGKSLSLEDCDNCPSASFCPLHNRKDSQAHAARCEAFRLCFDLDIAGTLFERQSPRHVVPFHMEKAYLPSSMSAFLDLYVDENKSLPMSSQCQRAYNSEYLTRPLSVLYALEKLDHPIESRLVIHVIGANMVEVDGLNVWEILLHWLSPLEDLTIVLIGPELVWGSTEPKTCDYCMKKSMTINVRLRNMLYHDYVMSQWYEKPDLLVGYNTGIHECMELGSTKDTWLHSVRTMGEQNCPLVLTSYTREESFEEHKRLCMILGDTLATICCLKNPFSSIRPHRDFETEDVFYQNQFINIYQEFSLINIFNNFNLTE